MAISRQQLLTQIQPGLAKLFNDEYNRYTRQPVDMDTTIRKKYNDVKNKAFIDVSVDTLLGLWMVLFPTGFAELKDVEAMSEDMRDVGRMLRDEGILKFNHNTYMYYIAKEFR